MLCCECVARRGRRLRDRERQAGQRKEERRSLSESESDDKDTGRVLIERSRSPNRFESSFVPLPRVHTARREPGAWRAVACDETITISTVASAPSLRPCFITSTSLYVSSDPVSRGYVK